MVLEVGLFAIIPQQPTVANEPSRFNLRKGASPIVKASTSHYAGIENELLLDLNQQPSLLATQQGA